MNFIDTAKIKISSGKGGNGIVAWRREKYEPHGGPAGGDGGKGGSVFIQADESLNTLLDFKYKSIFKAEDGEKGGPKNMTGKSGRDLVIKVPCGTMVRELNTKKIVADLLENNQKVLIAEGGRGGRGNTHFATSTRQAPRFCEPGEPPIERELELELKLIAEVGIIGMPNAGKSTLISVISSAKPKIADYPFTTLVPNLGVVKKPDGGGIVVADIPGLIEGASEGIGLGHEFMRHVERTKLLVHIVDGNGTDGVAPLESYEIIQRELRKYNQALVKKKQILVLNKIDLLNEKEIQSVKRNFAKKRLKPIFISAVAKKGIEQLLKVLFEALSKVSKKKDLSVEIFYDSDATDHKLDEILVYKEKKNFFIEGKKIQGLISVTDFKDYQSVGHLMRVFQSMGVFKMLDGHGAIEGDTVYIYGIKFEYSKETMVMV